MAPAACLLAYRLALLRRGYAVTQDAVSPEIGCGTGIHLLAVASELIDQRQRFVGDDLLQLIFRRAGARHISGTCLCRGGLAGRSWGKMNGASVGAFTGRTARRCRTTSAPWPWR
jgi:hypothetical protein